MAAIQTCIYKIERLKFSSCIENIFDINCLIYNRSSITFCTYNLSKNPYLLSFVLAIAYTSIFHNFIFYL